MKKLAKQFTFKVGSSGTTLYVATQNEDGSYRVRNEGHPDSVGAPWTASDMADFIIRATWIVTEVTIPADEEKPALKYVGRTINSVLNPYEMKAHPDGDRYILVNAGREYDFAYTEDRIQQLIEDYGWRLEEPVAPAVEASSLEPSDDSAPVWPFPPANHVEPEFLPPDDIPQVDFDLSGGVTVLPELTVATLRQFSEDTNGWYVEIDEDFITFKFDGEEVYVVSNEEDALSVMGAIRVLTKFSDKG